uniref:Globin n=1 Tax=Polypedilum nubifer TaxID=54969 RepID=V5YNF6_9DIPT|nr:globin [Polypedilum nubifer]
MGNVVSNVQEIIAANKEPPTPELKQLTQAQIDIIKRTWAVPYAKPADSGEIILYTFLERFPLAQQKFHAFRNTPIIMLKGTPGFRSHAQKIMKIFATAIDALGTENGLQVILGVVTEIGKYHRRRGIEKKHFNQLRSVILDILGQVCKLNDEEKKAWNDLMDTVYHVIFNVLDEGKKVNGKK